MPAAAPAAMTTCTCPPRFACPDPPAAATGEAAQLPASGLVTAADLGAGRQGGGRGVGPPAIEASAEAEAEASAEAAAVVAAAPASGAASAASSRAAAPPWGPHPAGVARGGRVPHPYRLGGTPQLGEVGADGCSGVGVLVSPGGAWRCPTLLHACSP